MKPWGRHRVSGFLPTIKHATCHPPGRGRADAPVSPRRLRPASLLDTLPCVRVMLPAGRCHPPDRKESPPAPTGVAASLPTLRPMRHPRNLLCLLALAAAGLAGCRTSSGPFAPLDSTKYTIESTDKFVALDETAQKNVSCTGLQERVLADGRLEVVANVRNRETRPFVVQVNCIFKDDQGAPIGDETPFRNLALPGSSTETVTFTSANNLARQYTIRVRQGR